jgi:hypothetical protein
MRTLSRLFIALAALGVAIAPAIAPAAADKPLVMESGKVKQLPASTTIQLNASGTGAASLNIPHGTAPTSPNNGDCWTTTGGLYCRINGATVGPYGTGSGSGSVTTTGSPASGNLTKFSGATSVTNGDLSGDVTTSGTLATTITNDAVSYAKLQNVSAASKLLRRGDSGSGDPQEITIGTGLTMTGATLSASGGGGSTAEILPGGRLTLVSGVAVLTSDQTAKTVIYYTPHISDLIPVYDGSAMVNETFAELTLTLDATNHVSASLYDIFVWNDSGTIKVGTGPAWSSTTARGAGAGTTELERKHGVWTNKVSITLKNGAGAGVAGVGANRATYVGTFYATANGQTGMAFKPSAAAGGTNNILGVYNAFNRVRTAAMSRDSTASWSYGTATWRAANNSASSRVSFVDGLAQSAIAAHYDVTSSGSAAGTDRSIGLNLDSTSANPDASVQATGTALLGMNISGNWAPQLGFHYIAPMEATNTTGTGSFYGAQATPTRQLNGMTVDLEM